MRGWRWRKCEGVMGSSGVIGDWRGTDGDEVCLYRATLLSGWSLSVKILDCIRSRKSENYAQGRRKCDVAMLGSRAGTACGSGVRARGANWRRRPKMGFRLLGELW